MPGNIFLRDGRVGKVAIAGELAVQQAVIATVAHELGVVVAAVDAGRDPCVLLEDPAKVVQVHKAALRIDVLDGLVGVGDEIAGRLDPDVVEVTENGGTGGLAEG